MGKFLLKNIIAFCCYLFSCFVCFWADIMGNHLPESSISGSNVQAQGPAIPKFPCNDVFSISLSGHTLLVQCHLIFRFFICRLVFEESSWRCTAPEAIQTTVQSKSTTTTRGQGQKGQIGLRSERSNIMDTGVS